MPDSPQKEKVVHWESPQEAVVVHQHGYEEDNLLGGQRSGVGVGVQEAGAQIEPGVVVRKIECDVLVSGMHDEQPIFLGEK